MGFLILIALIAVPLVEIAVFIQVGGVLGLWPTLGLILLTALLGSWQLRTQGLATLTKAREQMDRGVMPARELFDGLCLLVGGALLLTPGFVTDLLGGLLFVPPFREFLRRTLGRRIAAARQTRVYMDGEEVFRYRSDGDVIDGDYRTVAPEPPEDDPADRDPPRRLPQ